MLRKMMYTLISCFCVLVCFSYSEAVPIIYRATADIKPVVGFPNYDPVGWGGSSLLFEWVIESSGHPHGISDTTDYYTESYFPLSVAVMSSAPVLDIRLSIDGANSAGGGDAYFNIGSNHDTLNDYIGMSWEVPANFYEYYYPSMPIYDLTSTTVYFSLSMEYPYGTFGSDQYPWLVSPEGTNVAFTGASGVILGDYGSSFNPYNLQVQSFNIIPTPEPATILLLGSGLIGLAGLGRKKFKK